MHDKLTFKEKLRRKYIEQTEKDSEELRSRTSGYNKYFENWLEYEVTGPKGKRKILRIYDGAWYSHKLNTKQWILLKTGYVLLWLLAVGFFLGSAFCETLFNTTVLALVFETLTALALLLCGYQTAVYAALPRKMTIGQFNSGVVLLKRYYKIACFVYGAMVAVSLCFTLYDLLVGREVARKEMLCTLLFGLGLGAVYSVYRIENRMQYDIVSAKPTLPEGARKIKDREFSW